MHVYMYVHLHRGGESGGVQSSASLQINVTLLASFLLPGIQRAPEGIIPLWLHERILSGESPCLEGQHLGATTIES